MFDSRSARVVLLEGADRILGALAPRLSQHARKQLEALGVDVRTGSRVTHIDAEGVTYETQEPDGTTKSHRLAAGTLVWAAGVAASPLGRQLERTAAAKLDRRTV